MIVVEVLLGVMGLGVAWVASGLRVVRQWEQGVLFRFGKVEPGIRGPGLTRITPIRDRLRKVNMQIVTLPVPAQDGHHPGQRDRTGRRSRLLPGP